MRDSGILGGMLDSWTETADGEYNVVLTAEQYEQFQQIINHDKIETVSQAQGLLLHKFFCCCFRLQPKILLILKGGISDH